MPLFGSSHGASSKNHATLSNPSKVTFPTTFNAYHPKSLSSKVILGPSESQPIYMADFPTSGFSDIIMYDGPSDRGGTLAICKPHGIGQRSCTIYIPPMGTGNQPIQEELRTEKSILKEAYSFAVVVGQGPNARPEKFEWRSSGFAGRKGYQLVRLSTRNSDVVAEWKYDSMAGIKSKVAAFSFVGAGATGEMGDPWALMAVITFLRNLQVHVQALMGVAVAGA